MDIVLQQPGYKHARNRPNMTVTTKDVPKISDTNAPGEYNEESEMSSPKKRNVAEQQRHRSM